MIRLFPLIFVLLWSSAFITTKPIVDYSDPFAALAFRFSIVAFGFFLFSVFKKQKILVPKKMPLNQYLVVFCFMVYILAVYFFPFQKVYQQE